MTESGDPLENAVAERVNGILKKEYLDAQEIKSVKEAMRYLPIAIRLYNSERPHVSISTLIADKMHHATEPMNVKRIWKNYYPKNKTTVSGSHRQTCIFI